MDKKSIALLLVTSCFATSSFSNTLVNKLLPKRALKSASITVPHNVGKQSSRGFVDFSGTWIGNCGEGIETPPTVIENDDNWISFDGEEYRIGGGLEGKFRTNESYSDYDHTSVQWNADGTALVMNSVGVSKENGSDSSFFSDMSVFTMTMKKGQIIADGSWAQYSNGQKVADNSSMHCVFTRKQ